MNKIADKEKTTFKLFLDTVSEGQNYVKLVDAGLKPTYYNSVQLLKKDFTGGLDFMEASGSGTLKFYYLGHFVPDEKYCDVRPLTERENLERELVQIMRKRDDASAFYDLVSNEVLNIKEKSEKAYRTFDDLNRQMNLTRKRLEEIAKSELDNANQGI